MNIELPELSLVVLVGASGSGKSTFARRHFRSTEVISSDACRGMVSDDENAQSATPDAFELLRYIAGKRLKNGLLTVVDATSLRPEDRRGYVQLAREHHCLPVAIVLDVPERVCRERNERRSDRDFGPHVIRNQCRALHRHLRNLRREGFRYVSVLKTVEEVEAVTIKRAPLWNNKRHVSGPFDIVGDVHGCFDELVALLERLGYAIDRAGDREEGDWAIVPPMTDGRARTLVLLGDLVDRGPKSPAVLRLAMRMVREGTAYCVPGNHDVKLMRALRGTRVRIAFGLARTLEQLEGASDAFRDEIIAFIDGLVSHYVFDEGRLVVAHAGLKESLQGRGSGAVREFCLYGETTGETDEFGLPVRHNWAADYRGHAMVVYGHTPIPEPEWLNGTICIDAGCVFGGRLTALRYPEEELVSVPAREQYAEPARPLDIGSATDGAEVSAQQRHDDMLNLADVLGKRIIETRLQRSVTVREQNAAAALEVMSRFAIDPRWLIYLPPTMSPCETSARPGLLEHPAEAFDYYRHRGVGAVVCEEKHMGSRAVVVVCRDADIARERFGVTTGELGSCYTRTGRRFFDDLELETAFLSRLCRAIGAAGLWETLATSWVCLDCELLPWSAKAQVLLREQYAAVGCAARAALSDIIPELQETVRRLDDPVAGDLVVRFDEQLVAIERYTDAYRHYCWPVASLDDLRLAPFHVLAGDGAVHVDKDHVWHMSTLAALAAHDDLLMATPYRSVALTDAADCSAAVDWWESLTRAGGEGMVVKPEAFIESGRRGLLQPAIKCRGPEYLRIIYGPEYRRDEHLTRLRSRGLRHKRSLALREFALGIEGLERFVRGAPLRRVHECVFAVLALESEPVDPRL